MCQLVNRYLMPGDDGLHEPEGRTRRANVELKLPVMLAVSGGVAYFAAMLMERANLDLNPFSLRCDQSAKAVMRAFGVLPSGRDEA